MLARAPWFYMVAGRVHGPFDIGELRRRLQALVGRPGDPVVRCGESGEWQRPSQVPGLLDAFSGPADPDWPNAPEKVFAIVFLAFVTFQVSGLVHRQLVVPLLVAAKILSVVLDKGWGIALAIVFAAAGGALALLLPFVDVVGWR